MEYLVTMTTHVPDGTPDQAVADVRAREAARSRELAAQGHLRRLWRQPAGGPGVLGLWRARDAAEMQAIMESLPLYAWMTVGTTPLTPHPSDPVAARS
jgi:muconolactone D-isomerase